VKSGAVLLGFCDKGEIWTVNKYDREYGYDLSQVFARGGTELLLGVGTGGLSTAGKAGKVVALVDASGNVVAIVKGSVDIAENGLNFGNGAQVIAGSAGLGGNLAGAWPRRIPEQGRDELGRFLPTSGSQVPPGSTAEDRIWGAIARKRGWDLRKGRIHARDECGNIRILDGVVTSQRSNRTVGMEIKSGNATRSARQRLIDDALNSNRNSVLVGVGQNSDLTIQRVIVIRRER